MIDIFRKLKNPVLIDTFSLRLGIPTRKSVRLPFAVTPVAMRTSGWITEATALPPC